MYDKLTYMAPSVHSAVSFPVDDRQAAVHRTEFIAKTDKLMRLRDLLSSILEPVLAADDDSNPEECVAALLLIESLSFPSKEDTLGRWAGWGKMIMDALQGWMDKAPLDHELRRDIFYLLVKLSAATNELPPCLFISGVNIGSERDPLRIGGLADVYKGTYQTRLVAIKKLRVLERSKAKLHSKICREALIWRQLHHPHVLPLCGLDCKTFTSTCMVSPWIELGTMESFLKTSLYQPKRDGNRLLREVALGLVYLHSQKIVHGDVTWNNILIDSNLQARISGFSLMDISESTIGLLATSDPGTGTVRWMSPERIDALEATRPLPEYDVYAFGCLCLALYTLQPPFPHTSTMKVVFAVCQGQRPTRPTKKDYHGIEFSDEMWEMVVRCWAHKPADRPSMQDVADFLQFS